MIEKIIETVKKAGEIYKNAAGNLGIESKGSAVNLVTEYDKKIQDFLFEALSKIIPDCSKRARATKSFRMVIALLLIRLTEQLISLKAFSTVQFPLDLPRTKSLLQA